MIHHAEKAQLVEAGLLTANGDSIEITPLGRIAGTDEPRGRAGAARRVKRLGECNGWAHEAVRGPSVPCDLAA